MIRFTEVPLITDSNPQELSDWIRRQIDINSSMKNGYKDVPQQTILRILLSQLRAEDFHFQVEMSKARIAGMKISTAKEMAKNLNDAGLTAAWQDKLERDGITLAKLAAFSLKKSIEDQNPWTSRVEALKRKFRRGSKNSEGNA